MSNFFLCFLFSVLSSYGMAIVLVQKKNDWPVKWFHDNLKVGLGWINPQLVGMLDCEVCTSFWTTLVTDIVICIFNHGYFAWPLSGFVVSGLVWTVLNALPPE